MDESIFSTIVARLPQQLKTVEKDVYQRSVALAASFMRKRTASIVLVKRKYLMCLTNDLRDNFFLPHNLLELKSAYFENAEWAILDPLPLATHLIVRPTWEYGDYTVTADLIDCEACQLRVGLAAMPSRFVASFDKFEHALDAALHIQQEERLPGGVYYDGNEIITSISGWRELGLKLTSTEHYEELEYLDKAMCDLTGKMSGAASLLLIPDDVPDIIRTVIDRAIDETIFFDKQ